MAIGDEQVDVTIRLDVDAGDIDQKILGDFARAAGALDKLLQKLAKGAIRDIGNASSKAFDDKHARALNDMASRLEDTLNGVSKTTKGLKNNFTDAFDADSMIQLEDQTNKLVIAQEKLNRAWEEGDQFTFDALKAEIRTIQTGLATQRELVLRASRDKDEQARNAERNSRQESRVAVQESKRAQGAYAVDRQKEIASSRDATNRAVEDTRAASRKRVALLQAAARTIATIERSLRSVFRGTSRAVSASFRGITRSASTAASGVRRVFTRNAQDVGGSARSIRNSYKKEFSESTSIVRNETKNQKSIINNFAREASASIGGIGVGGLAVGGILGIGLGKALSGGFTRAANLQDAEKALTFLLNSQEKAAELQGEILKIVEGTPFALDQFNTATTQLISFGIEADKIPGYLQAIGDVAILSSSQSTTIDSLVRVFGQISAAGKLTGEDLNQLSEASVPALRILGNSLGKTVAETRELVSKGLIPAEQALEILSTGINKGTDGVNGATNAFQGLSKELGTGLRGSLANFKISIDRLGAGIFDALEKPIVSALAAGTAAIDFLGKAISRTAIAVADSSAFAVLTKVLEGVAVGLTKAKNALVPFLDFIAGGAVLFAQLAGGIFLLKRVPAIVAAVGRAVAFILSPINLLIAAGVLVSSFVKRLYDESKDLRDALTRIVVVFRTVSNVISDVVVEALRAFVGGAGTASDFVGVLAGKVTDVAIPALERFATFMETKVLPTVRRFAKFVREEIVPVLGRALGNAADLASTSLKTTVRLFQVAFGILAKGDFIGSGGISWLEEDGAIVGGLFRVREVLEDTVRFFRVTLGILAKGDFIGSGGISWLEEDGAIVGGLFRVRSAMEGIVSYVKNNLAPVLAGVGAGLGVLALSGGNIPLAGLAGLGTGIAFALSNPAIRNALIENIQKGVKAAQGFIGDIFDGGTLAKIGVGALKGAKLIGEKIGGFLSNNKTLALVGAVVGFAAALAGSFAVGFIEGVARNIDDIVKGLSDLLGKAFQAAIKEAVSNPKIGLAIAGILLAAGVVRNIRSASRKTGQIIAQQLSDGVQNGATASPGTSGFGGGANNFFSTLFGGRASIEKNIKKEMAQISKTTTGEFQRQQRIIRAATGNIARNADGTFLKTRDVRATTDALAGIEANMGATRLAAIKLRTGLGELFTKGQFRDGLTTIGEGLKGSAGAIGSVAGAAAGGAFAASFVATAIFANEATGQEKLTSALGLAATAIGTGAVIGGPVGVAVGAGVAGFGLLSSALKNNADEAKNAKLKIENYAKAIRDAAQEELPNLFDNILDNPIVDKLSDDAVNALTAIDFTIPALSLSLSAGTVEEDFGNLDELLAAVSGVEFIRRQFESGFKEDGLRTPFGIEELEAVDLGPFIEDLIKSGVSAEALAEIIRVVGGEVVALEEGGARSNLVKPITDLIPKVTEAKLRYEGLKNSAANTEAAIEASASATGAFKDKVNELNEARLDGLRDKVTEAKGLLDDAKTAADDAKNALVAFLTGDTVVASFAETINSGVLSIEGFATGIGTTLANEGARGATAIAAEVATQLAGASAEARTILTEGFAKGEILTKEDAEAALAPLLTAAGEVGGEGGTAIQTALQEIIANFDTTEGAGLLAKAFDIDAQIPLLQAKLNEEQNILNFRIGLDPLEITPIVDAARIAFDEAGQASLDGYVGGLDDPDGKAAKAATTIIENALAAAKEAQDSNSPSVEYEKLGKFAVDGYVKGITDSKAAATIAGGSLVVAGLTGARLAAAGTTVGMYVLGQNVMDGFALGMASRSALVAGTAAGVAKAAAEAVAEALDINSPSKIMSALGVNTMQGFALGIERSAQLVADAAAGAMTGAVDAASNVIGDVGAIVGTTGPSTSGTIISGGGGGSLDVKALAQAIADTSKPNVQIDQTFNEKVDSRAIATDVAWRLS